MDGEHHQQPLPGQLLEQPQQRQLMVQIEPGQRLVQQQYPAIRVEARPHLQQGAGDQHPLLLSARQPAEVPRQQGFQLQRLTQRLNSLVLPGRRLSLIEPQAQHLKHRDMEQLGLALRQHGAPLRQFRPAQVRQRLAADAHLPLPRQEAGQGPEQGRLAAAVGAEQGHQLATLPGKVEWGEPVGDGEGAGRQQGRLAPEVIRCWHGHLASTTDR